METAALRRTLGEWERSGGGALYEQLAGALSGLIERGDLPPGMRLPPERRLASALGVSRGTVVAALDRLRAGGLVNSRQGSGTVVAGAPPPARESTEPNLTALVGLNVAAGHARGERFVDLQAAAWAGAGDLPATAFGPGPDLDAALASQGYAPSGVLELRAAIAEYLTADRDLPTTPEQVLVTTGAHQAIGLLARMSAGPGDPVAVEALTYPGARDIARAGGNRIAAARLTPQGVDVDALERLVAAERPRLVYLIPTVHNPTGTVLPADRRERLVHAVAGWNTVVVDDESLAETLLEGDAPPPLAALARNGEAASRIFTVGSASKSFWGGLRIGWVRGPEPAIATLARLKTVADLACPVLSQVVTSRLLARRHEILPARRDVLRTNLDVLTGALSEQLPDWRWKRPAGGLALWVQLPDGEGAGFTDTALRYGVGVVPGTVCSADGRADDHVRLSLGQPPAVLREGVERLADAWRAHRQGDTSAPAGVTV